MITIHLQPHDPTQAVHTLQVKPGQSLMQAAVEARNGSSILGEGPTSAAILIGQSDGASIALAYAGAFPQRVRGVIAARTRSQSGA